MLRLEAIKFNHDSSSANVDSFNIRKDKRNFVEVPEWRRGLSFNPEDSPAAYSLFDTRGNTLTIQASFSCDDRRTRTIEVRALDASLYPRATGSSPLSALAARLLGVISDNARGNILGEVKAKRVELRNGKSEFETFKLKNVRLWDGGVAVEDIAWRWQYRIYPDDSWTDLAVTKHRIYTTLRKPHEPWQQIRFHRSNLQLPWTAVLEYACRWAAGAQNPTDAATLITRSVYQLGRDGLATYFEDSQYTHGPFNAFNCADFLFDLKLGVMKLNCTDCATIVSSFANILGSELWQSEMKKFNYNPIIRIGESHWQEGHFNFHMVAWEEDCDVHNDVFDACLQIDGDEDPTKSDRCRIPILPTDLRFGRRQEKLYRDRLVAPKNDVDAATPQPCTRIRRGIHTRLPSTRCISQELLDLAAQRFDFGQLNYGPPAGGLLSASELLDDFFPDGTQLRSELLTTTDKAVVRESLWRFSSEEEEGLLLIKIYEGPSFESAHEWLQSVIASLHSFDRVHQETVDLADAFFVVGEHGGVIFTIRNVGVSLVNVGKSVVSLGTIARSMLQKLAATGN